MLVALGLNGLDPDKYDETFMVVSGALCFSSFIIGDKFQLTLLDNMLTSVLLECIHRRTLICSSLNKFTEKISYQNFYFTHSM